MKTRWSSPIPGSTSGPSSTFLVLLWRCWPSSPGGRCWRRCEAAPGRRSASRSTTRGRRSRSWNGCTSSRSGSSREARARGRRHPLEHALRRQPLPRGAEAEGAGRSRRHRQERREADRAGNGARAAADPHRGGRPLGGDRLEAAAAQRLERRQRTPDRRHVQADRSQPATPASRGRRGAVGQVRYCSTMSDCVHCLVLTARRGARRPRALRLRGPRAGAAEICRRHPPRRLGAGARPGPRRAPLRAARRSAGACACRRHARLPFGQAFTRLPRRRRHRQRHARSAWSPASRPRSSSPATTWRPREAVASLAIDNLDLRGVGDRRWSASASW